MLSGTFKMCLVLVVAASALSLTLGADRPRVERTDNPKKQPINTERVVTEENEFAGLNAVVLDDGYWAIAGVVGLSKDSFGRIVIDVKKDGDFDQDMVLTFPVRLIEFEDGDLVVAGIAGMSVAGDTLTLYMEDLSLGGVAAAENCTMLPTGKCKNFSCTASCKIVDNNGVPGCACGSVTDTE